MKYQAYPPPPLNKNTWNFVIPQNIPILHLGLKKP